MAGSGRLSSSTADRHLAAQHRIWAMQQSSRTATWLSLESNGLHRAHRVAAIALAQNRA